MIWTPNLQNMLETPLPFFISKKPGEIPIFGTSLAKKSILDHISLKIDIFQVGHVLLRHCDVICRPIFMIVVSMEWRDPILNYGTKQLYFGSVTFNFKGVVTTPLRKTCYQKKKKKKPAEEDGVNLWCRELTWLNLEVSAFVSSRNPWHFRSMLNNGSSSL